MSEPKESTVRICIDDLIVSGRGNSYSFIVNGQEVPYVQKFVFTVGIDDPPSVQITQRVSNFTATPPVIVEGT